MATFAKRKGAASGTISVSVAGHPDPIEISGSKTFKTDDQFLVQDLLRNPDLELVNDDTTETPAIAGTPEKKGGK